LSRLHLLCLALPCFVLLYFSFISFDFILLWNPLTNHSDNQNKFDIEMNHSFPFNLSIQRENALRQKESVQTEKNQICDWDCEDQFDSTICSSSFLLSLPQFVNSRLATHELPSDWVTDFDNCDMNHQFSGSLVHEWWMIEVLNHYRTDFVLSWSTFISSVIQLSKGCSERDLKMNQQTNHNIRSCFHIGNDDISIKLIKLKMNFQMIRKVSRSINESSHEIMNVEISKCRNVGMYELMNWKTLNELWIDYGSPLSEWIISIIIPLTHLKMKVYKRFHRFMKIAWDFKIERLCLIRFVQRHHMESNVPKLDFQNQWCKHADQFVWQIWY
jgi:hypothetical protein